MSLHDQAGWMWGGFIRPEPGAASGMRATVADNGVRFRGGPSLQADIITEVAAGTAIMLRREEFWPVGLGERSGWMWGGFLDFADDA